VVFDSASIRRNQEFEEAGPAQVRRAVWKPPAVEPITRRTWNPVPLAGAFKARRTTGSKANVGACLDRDDGRREGEGTLESEAVQSVQRGAAAFAQAPGPLVLVLGLPEPSPLSPPLLAVNFRKSPRTRSFGAR
jgi:hypothetical protein